MRRRVLGYTLVEVMVVIGIVAVIAAIGIPVASHMRNKSRLTKVARELQARVTQARALAATATPDPAWPAGSRVQSAGIRIESQQSYTVFIDRDVADGGESVVSVIDFTQQEGPGTSLGFRNPSTFPTTIRMSRNGQLTSGAQVDVVVEDRTGQSNGTDSKTVRINLSGTPRIL